MQRSAKETATQVNHIPERGDCTRSPKYGAAVFQSVIQFLCVSIRARICMSICVCIAGQVILIVFQQIKEKSYRDDGVVL